MSWQAVAWALNRAPHLHTEKGLPDTTARAVLVALAEKADERGADAYPSPLRIHYMTGYDVRTAQRALDRLEAGGLIARDGFGPSGTVNWKLAVHLVRSDEWESLVAEADKKRVEESAKRQARRIRQASTTDDVSGTQNPGHSTASPGRSAPLTTQYNLPLNHPLGAPRPQTPEDPMTLRAIGLKT